MMITRVVAWLLRYWRNVLGTLILTSGVYVVVSSLGNGRGSDGLASWLNKNGDAELKGYYANIQDEGRRQSFGAACKIYEGHYGKGAWVQHFKKDNPDLSTATYMDIAELAVGIASAEDRDAFLDAHAATYEVCVKSGNVNAAHQYAEWLKELKIKGGRDWQVTSNNPFAIGVYAAVRQQPKLWDWYLSNHGWCDPFLMTCMPGDGAGLDEVVDFVSGHEQLMRRFHQEISALSTEELKELADGDDELEAKDAVYASCLTFVGHYHDVLEGILKGAPEIPMLEAMAVLANNADCFEMENQSSRHNAAKELLALHGQHRILWDFAAEEMGQGVVKFHRDVPQYSEQLVGSFGEQHVIEFLYKYYGTSPTLIRVASEILYRCQEPGWAVLCKFKDNRQFKSMMENPRIGFRVVPYYLIKGDAIFTSLITDARYVDELLDKEGKLKRKDVSWYEMSPIGGDLATVTKKWLQNRPIEPKEMGWAVFDVVDIAAMALTMGSAKAATTTVKVGGKATVKRIGRSATRKIAGGALRRVNQGKYWVRGQRRLTREVIKNSGRSARRGMSFWKRTVSAFRHAKLGKAVDAMKTAGGKFQKGMKKQLTRIKDLSPEAKARIYRSANAAAFIKWGVYTLPEKGPDFIHNVVEDLGELVGKTIHAVVSGTADGVKASVREALGLHNGGSGESLVMRFVWLFLGGVMVLGGLKYALTLKRS